VVEHLARPITLRDCRNKVTITPSHDFRNGVTKLLAVQCKMARVAVAWGVRDLAREAGVSTDTVARLERGEALKESTLAAIRTALEAAGVEFTNEDAPGVRLRRVEPE